MFRGAIVVLIMGIFLFGGGCGGGGSDHAQETWSITVADNIGPQTGPNQVAALRTAVEAYRGNDPSKRDFATHGCRPASGELVWSCQVTAGDCRATVTVTFDSVADSSAQATDFKERCPNVSSAGVFGH